jgi:NAD(P)-dependent dehydrogenase (short-subunit alcohol dehydrogenase family)
MELVPGKIAVVTGAGSGIGLALAERFAASGMHVVLADVDEAALEVAAGQVAARGVETLAVPTDVSDEAAVAALAAATVKRFGTAHVVCNNAGVASRSDPWFGPLSAWTWVVGVNLWGVIHGIRAFLPILLAQGEGHFVNTASAAGLMPGIGPIYDATKHAVVAVTEDLYSTLGAIGAPIGVSVLCPGWVRTQIMAADRNWPEALGQRPPDAFGSDLVARHVARAIAEGTTPAAIADQVAGAISARRYWILPGGGFLEAASRRWASIAEGRDPELFMDLPGLPPAQEILAEIARLFETPAD